MSHAHMSGHTHPWKASSFVVFGIIDASGMHPACVAGQHFCRPVAVANTLGISNFNRD